MDSGQLRRCLGKRLMEIDELKNIIENIELFLIMSFFLLLFGRRLELMCCLKMILRDGIVEVEIGSKNLVRHNLHWPVNPAGRGNTITQGSIPSAHHRRIPLR